MKTLNIITVKKSRANLFRDAKSGKLSLELIERYGNTKLPTHMQGKRKVVKANTVSLKLQNKDGKVSTLDIPKATLIEYMYDTLIIYDAGYRKPTSLEQKILNEWGNIEKTKEYKEQCINDAYSDGSSSYWKEKAFFKKHNAEYLMGLEMEKGLLLDFNRRKDGKENFIKDEKIKGKPILKYNVYLESVNA